MEQLIKIYRWENGKILEREIQKNEVKYMTGWRTMPDEAMFAQLETKKYTIENLIHDVKNRLNEISELEDCIKDLDIPIPKIPENNNFGLSTESIEELINKLEKVLINNKNR